MRQSNLFFKTFKEAPSDADIPSHRYLEQAGYIRRLSRGHYTYTPLMWRVINKLKAIICEEMNEAGAQEIFMPQLHPKGIWEASGRWDAYKAEKLTFIVPDRDENEFCLGPTHEEVITDLVKNWLTSYKHLPVNLYQISNKFRDEIRPRFGLMRSKEFFMKDAYSFCANTQEMDDQYYKMREAYQRILNRLELDYVVVKADSGKIGTGLSEEFQVLADIGEDTILTCGDYAFNSEKAPLTLKAFEYDAELKKMEKVHTPKTKTIEELAKFFEKPKEILLKTLIYKLTHKDSEEFIAVGIRSDRDINKVKLTNCLNALEIDLATDDEIKKLKLENGYIGPVGCSIPFIADESCKPMKNFVCGANKRDYHLINVNFDRDVNAPAFHDVCQAKDGDLCPLVEDGVYEERRGIEVGHIFNLGDKYSVALKAQFQDENGKPQPFLMGCYGMGVGRCAQAAVEQNYDDKGIVWPLEIAPYHILLTAVNAKDEEQSKAADAIYKKLQSWHAQVLYDDRPERLGFKLKDSDLIGMPFKMIIGKKYFEDESIEVESRKGEKDLIKAKDIKSWLEENLLNKLPSNTR